MTEPEKKKKSAPKKKKDAEPVPTISVETSVHEIQSVTQQQQQQIATQSAPQAVAQTILDSTHAKEQHVEEAELDAKKRGRKPRGAKITTKQIQSSQNTNNIPNIILHLKCNTNDLNEYSQQLNKLLNLPKETGENPVANITPATEIYTYENPDINYSVLTNSNNLAYQKQLKYVEPPPHLAKHGVEHYGGGGATGGANLSTICQKCMLTINEEDIPLEDPELENISTKELTAKLKSLKIQLYKNYLKNDTKSACFWCTCDYDNMSCYIPKYEIDGVIYGYGSFCRPECGVAYLMRENIDDSTKFERYHLMNQIYGKLYGCKKNIKPAPNPYYLLDKFYGNLSIQEYRKLLKTDHLYMVIEKPLTRILPELHEDNDELSSSIYDTAKSATSSNGVYKVKRQSEKQQGPSKMSILKQNFNIG